jgi:hypothetical protein
MGEIELDTTLTKEGQAADAKAVGNAIQNIELKEGPKGDKGDSGVYVGTEAPDDDSVNIWIDPEGSPSSLPVASPDTLGGV